MINLLNSKNNDAPFQLIVGESPRLNDLLVKEIVANKFNPGMEKVVVDAESDGLDELIATLSESSLFGDQKIVIIKNPLFLTGKPNKFTKGDLSQLENVFAEVGSIEDVIIIDAPYESLDARKKITKAIKKEFNLIDTNVDQKLLPKIANEILTNADYQIEKSALNLLLTRSNNQVDDLIANLDKLMTAAKTKNIDQQLVSDQISQSLEENVFEILDAVLTGNYEKSINQLEEQFARGTDPIGIVGVLISQVTLFFQVKNLQHLSDNDLSKLLKVHPYRVKLAREKKLPVQKADNLLKSLIDLDFKYKSGQIKGQMYLKSIILSI